MDSTDVLRAAHAARRRRDWRRAYDLFAAAREAGPLSAEDLGALSDVSWWLGRVDEVIAAGEAAFRAYLEDERRRDAAMMALDIAVTLLLRGDDAVGSGWISRAQRLVEPFPDSVEHGYVRYVVDVEGGLEAEDPKAVAVAARELQQVGRRHGDRSLTAAGIVGEGRALLKLGDASRGMRLLDEAMVAVLHDDLDPEWAGNIYCHLMAACHEIGDIRRAGQWTEATTTWLAQLPSAAVFTGICRVHRSQVLQIAGAWDRAEREAAQVCDDLAGVHVTSVAEAPYQLGNLRRLRGDLGGAEQSYALARQLGRDPQPGVALLCLARGRVDAARAAITSALHAASGNRLARAWLSAAQVEIALAAGDLDDARRGCVELEDAAATYRTSGLEAAALHWRGAVVLAEHRPHEALPALRAACRRWNEVGAPYDAARTCTLLAAAYRALGDRDTAAAELAAADATFARLGVPGDASMSEAVGTRAPPGGLTEREAEVLGLVAGGSTNREVAATLVLSEKTVARHVSNIFAKLGVSTRTEAAAFAFEHGLARSRRG